VDENMTLDYSDLFIHRHL